MEELHMRRNNFNTASVAGLIVIAVLILAIIISAIIPLSAPQNAKSQYFCNVKVLEHITKIITIGESFALYT